MFQSSVKPRKESPNLSFISKGCAKQFDQRRVLRFGLREKIFLQKDMFYWVSRYCLWWEFCGVSGDVFR